MTCLASIDSRCPVIFFFPKFVGTEQCRDFKPRSLSNAADLAQGLRSNFLWEKKGERAKHKWGGSMLYKHKSSLGNQAKQEWADRACQTRGEGRSGTRLVLQASNQNRLKLHEKALVHECSHTKKGACCTRKGSTAGLISVTLNPHS